MTTTDVEAVGPGTFTRDAHSVTIAEDGRILVKKNDWLSKYSWALYGDYDHIDSEYFVRPDPPLKSAADKIVGIKEIDNLDLIHEGEYLIHVPTYFHWAEERGQPTPVPPKSHKPLPPEKVKSRNWQAADLGGFDATVLAGGAGGAFLAFRNLDVGKTFYYALIWCGGGVGVDIPLDRRSARLLLRALWISLGLKRMIQAQFVPVTVLRDFNAVNLAYDFTIDCYGWTIPRGPGVYEDYRKLTGRIRTSNYFHVEFKQRSWDVPGFDGHFGGGKLFWIW